MTMDKLLLLKKAKDGVIEERNKAQEEEQERQRNGAGAMKTPSTGSMPSSASSAMASAKAMASKYGVSLPNF